MHAIFCIDDILIVIISHITSDRQTLANLNATAKVFRERTLDAIWYKQESFLPCFRALSHITQPPIRASQTIIHEKRGVSGWFRQAFSRSAGSSEQKVCFRNDLNSTYSPPVQDELTVHADHIRQILFYFGRIRVFAITRPRIPPSVEFYELLETVCRQSILFPNLRAFAAARSSANPCFRFILLATGNLLSQVSFHSSIVVPIHHELQRHAPNLRILNISIAASVAHDDPADPGRLFCTLLPECHSLEDLSVSCHDEFFDLDEFRTKASQIPSLRSLTLKFRVVLSPPTGPDSSEVTPTAVFRSLGTLHLDLQSIACAIRFLQKASTPGLKVLIGGFSLHAPPTQSEVAAFCQALALSCLTQDHSPSIRDRSKRSKLSVLYIGTRLNHDSISNGPSEGFIPAKALRPLLQLPSIYALYLVSEWPWEFDNKTAAGIASEWPVLFSLTLRRPEPRSAPGRYSRLSIQALRTLATSKSLRRLDTEVIFGAETLATALKEMVDVFKTRASSSEITSSDQRSILNSLDVGFSPMYTACIRRTAIFLACLFPSLKSLSASWSPDDTPGQSWKQVGELMGKDVLITLGIKKQIAL